MKKIIIRFNAPVILSFALLSLIALLLGNWTNGAATTQYFSVYRSSLADPLTYVRFFGHVLGHSGYVFYLGGEIMDGLFKQDNVSQIAHIVGGLCGLVFGFTVRRGRR